MLLARVTLVACLAALSLAPVAAAEPPTLAVTAAPLTGAGPLAVDFRAEGTGVLHSWDFGDGSHAEGDAVRHVYDRPGRYRVAIVATGADGQTTRSELVVTAVAVSLRAPATATFGAQVRLSGAVEPALAGARVELERDGRAVAAVRTDARGAFSATVRAGAGAYVARVAGAASPPRRLTIRPVVDATAEGGGIVGRPLVLAARVRPADAGRLQVTVWRNGKRTHAASHGAAARIGLASGAPGTFRIELRVVPAEGYAAAARTVRTSVTVPNLGPGARGPAVRVVKERLAELRYALPRVDGVYDLQTTEAVYAFQKVHGLPRTGRVDARVWSLMRTASTPLPRFRGTHVEVSKGRNVLYVVRNSRVETIVHVSTGRTGNTPLGSYRIYRKVPGWDWTLYYPLYFLGGFAIHGYTSVPPYPASAGCVRVPTWFAPRLYGQFTHGQLVRLYW